MSHDFKGKPAIVTGAAQGIGFEIARQLTRAGANVVVADSAKAAVVNLTETAAIELRGHGVRVNAVLPGFAATGPDAGLF